jgi:hypothetical protein
MKQHLLVIAPRGNTGNAHDGREGLPATRLPVEADAVPVRLIIVATDLVQQGAPPCGGIRRQYCAAGRPMGKQQERFGGTARR